ncbi:MAG: ATP-dependent DNA helicase RecG, partial [bacterium]|nr:ATP-dependent DNA helicase RecG [bacterium]
LDYYPYRYEDYSNLLPIAKIRPGDVSIRVAIKQSKGRWIRGGLHITEAVVSDDSGSVKVVWFNQPYREASIKHGEEYFLSGKLEYKASRLSINNPSLELVSDFPVNTARIVPVYRQSKDIKSTLLRRSLRACFQSTKTIETSLPESVIKRQKLMTKHEALKKIHFPEKKEDVEEARFRLGFEEVFDVMLANAVLKRDSKKQNAIPIKFDLKLAKKFLAELPFRLTDSQKSAVWKIYQDIEKNHPMNRLIEGDVGSGKTLVAVMATIMCAKVGYQTAVMAPTEILARQHAETFIEVLRPLSMENSVVLLVGSMSSKQKIAARLAIEEGRAQIIIGTHALIQEKVSMEKLALAVVDEQHRFGVDQRKALLKKAKHMPHMLSMTATPIPRSLALTVYGELEITRMKQKPNSRKTIKSKLVDPSDRNKIYKLLKERIAEGDQIFVVCPLIDPNSMLKAVSVEEAAKNIQKAIPGAKVEILHGKQKSEDKEKTMLEMKQGKIDILVSTTVVEVGVDIPNATTMLIESPERFGLAQIHQLRGRVGRGEKQGYCYLMMSSSTSPSRRLRALEQSSDGFQLSELDLEIRGPGAIYGRMQHGELDLRLVQLSDHRLISAAKKEVDKFIKDEEDLLQYPRLHKRVEQLQKVNHLN